MRSGLQLHLVVIVLCAGCLPDCPGDPGGSGGGGGSSSSTLRYDLVSALGEWTVTHTGTRGSCTENTTSSKLTLTLPKVDEGAVRFNARAGTLSGGIDVQIGRPPRQGTETCGTQPAGPCPRTADMQSDNSSFLLLHTLDPLPKDAPSGFAFIPTLEFALPSLCGNTSYTTGPAYKRGKPVSIAQLQSGQFVVEGSGSAPIFPKPELPGDPPTVLTGAISWSFRLVFQTADYDPSKAVAAPMLTLYDECLSDQPTTVEDLEAAIALFADAGTDVPLSANGCRRVRATSGAVSTLSHERTRGTKLVFDPATNTTRSERDVHVSYLRETDSAGVREKNDVNGDGIFESTNEQTFDGADVWQRSITKELDAAGVVTRQFTFARLDPLTMSVSVEERINGTLSPIEAGVVPISQNSCFTPTSMQAKDCAPAPGPAPTCGGMRKACSSQQKTDLLKALAEATKKGQDCLEKAGFSAFDPNGKALTLVATDNLRFFCNTDPCGPFGSLSTKPDRNGKYELTVNTVRNGPAELQVTLFHEMMHSDDRFFHNDNLVAAAKNACKLPLSDRTSACEAMCFAPAAAASCACVRCLSPSIDAPSKEVCEKCKPYGECPGRVETANGNTFKVSQAIGAWCERTKTFCDTKAECDSQCVGISCRQIKGTCDAACN